MTGSGTALLLTGGHSHPPEMSIEALREVTTGARLRPIVTTDLEVALDDLGRSNPSLVVVNALRFTMPHPRYDEFRDAWAFSLSAPARRAFAEWIRRGHPVLALHSALVSFDDWDEWGDLIGGRWDWNASHHPPVGPVEVHCDPTHPVTRGLGDFTVTDESYVDLDVRDGNTLVATSATTSGGPQPACWLREVDGSRVAVSALGHDTESLDQPTHRALLARLVDWLLDDRPDAEEAPPA
ncbi:MAG TPA: ThuA domain-containing protein [Acidimicrobiales bacterium]|nr:ThuA domain-containing protein [Acidimicrobiales bacterium]